MKTCDSVREWLDESKYHQCESKSLLSSYSPVDGLYAHCCEGCGESFEIAATVVETTISELGDMEDSVRRSLETMEGRCALAAACHAPPVVAKRPPVQKPGMSAADLAVLEQRGQALGNAVDLVRELARSGLADVDDEDDSDEILCLKGLVVRARDVVESLGW